ncbi:MAG: hypothetical protein ACR2RE_05775 [Geminicoccaceae bacterium]
MKDPVDLDQLENLGDDQLDFIEQILMRELQGLGQAQERLRIALAAIKLQRQNNKKNKKK